VLNAALELGDGDAVLWVALEDHAEDLIQLVRQWQDGLQEVPVPGKGPVCGILQRGLLPRITATCQVDKDYTQGPHIVGGTPVRRVPGGLVQAF
jgi:hypothetical protein